MVGCMSHVGVYAVPPEFSRLNWLAGVNDGCSPFGSLEMLNRHYSEKEPSHDIINLSPLCTYLNILLSS